MSIRVRLVALCLLISLLPALPLSFLVKSLLEKSFDVGLSDTIEHSLQSGLVVSRIHLERLRADFEVDVRRILVALPEHPGGSKDAVDAMDHMTALNLTRSVDTQAVAGTLPVALEPYHADPALRGLLEKTGPLREREAEPSTLGEHYFESENRAYQLALWNQILFYRETDPEFLANANALLSGRQIFAQLRLTQATLSRSFFYPFIIIYGVILVLSLTLALLMSERLAQPIRRLAQGAKVVASGDWSYRAKFKAGGEVGRLVGAFNTMVSRLDAQRRRLVEMERMATWRDMARHLAHEIKNPLLPIRLTVEELKDQYPGDDAQYRKMLQESARVIGDELDHLSKLVKEFSSFARMPDIAPRPGHIEPLANDVARLYPQLATNIECEPGLPAFSFDPDQIRIVLVNLFENAAAVMSDIADPQVRVSVGKVGTDIVMMVSDNGPGIAKENVDRIFDPYFTTRAEGTGLGLAMVKNIVLLHGGTIHVHSATGKGTTFTVTLPLAGPDATAKEES
jgi:nitrogen fixation/metabolism regulation signal transduction histidine kinase